MARVVAGNERSGTVAALCEGAHPQSIRNSDAKNRAQLGDEFPRALVDLRDTGMRRLWRCWTRPASEPAKRVARDSVVDPTDATAASRMMVTLAGGQGAEEAVRFSFGTGGEEEGVGGAGGRAIAEAEAP